MFYSVSIIVSGEHIRNFFLSKGNGTAHLNFASKMIFSCRSPSHSQSAARRTRTSAWPERWSGRLGLQTRPLWRVSVIRDSDLRRGRLVTMTREPEYRGQTRNIIMMSRESLIMMHRRR